MSEFNEPRHRWTEWIGGVITGSLFILEIILCVFFYNWINLTWLNILGWILIAIAFFVLGWLGRLDLTKYGDAPKNKNWIHTTVIVDRGIYSIVRHPIYLSWYFYFVAFIFISQHWLTIVFAVPAFISVYFDTIHEEKSNLQKFGNTYRHYMNRVPRLNFLVGILRALRQK